jgi:hypothetical protein
MAAFLDGKLDFGLQARSPLQPGPVDFLQKFCSKTDRRSESCIREPAASTVWIVYRRLKGRKPWQD